uniref:NADH dehydrogenase subunit 4 n=1 Tax=Euwallacea interjectus TaxID=321055 RepID=UPI0022A7E383|nr:NADH dehydrogenase subunit 4 [Euwallacea interjectus]UZT26981.1 NADH dehydrogenase subunit 4 [Euwallacea interjectus]WEP25218.1 NADH dehydrogenase subunit 4 [Euwallacea interjectus]
MDLIMSLIGLMLALFFVSFWFSLFCGLILTFLFLLKLSFSSEILYMSCGLGVDLLSFTLVGLSLWICCLMVLASGELNKLNIYKSFFIFVVFFLLLSLTLTFMSMNMFMFYLFFEVSLIPTLILIIGWGNQPERIQAGMYLLFYTLVVSLPMMMGLFFLDFNGSSLEFYFFKDLSNLFIYMCFSMVFFIKIPMFLVHLWLPKAHVEAPISGSMILAGIMLKLGGYGLLRTMKILFNIGMKINLIFIIISLVGAVLISLVCIRQSDMKMLIAYSSVSHMGLVLASILTYNLWGSWGALGLMLAHGLSSSGLFCIANILYERTHSRSMFLNKGFINIMPSLSLWWFLFCSSNMSAPPSFNLVGEVILINSLFLYSGYMLFFTFFLVFYSGVYSLFLYSFTQHGQFYSGVFSIYQVNGREYLLLFLHWVPLNLLFLKGEFFLCWI